MTHLEKRIAGWMFNNASRFTSPEDRSVDALTMALAWAAENGHLPLDPNHLAIEVAVDVSLQVEGRE